MLFFYYLLILTLLSGFQKPAIFLQQQQQTTAIKSVKYTTFKVEYSKNLILKGKAVSLPEEYPVHYPSSEQHYSPDGLLTEELWPDQKSIIEYDSLHRITNETLITENDTIIIHTAYEPLGIASRSLRISGDRSKTFKELPDPSPEDEAYMNLLFTEKDSNAYRQYEKIKMIPFTIYRLFDQQKRLVKEKFIKVKQNPFPYKPDSILKKQHIRYYKETLPKSIHRSTDYLTHLGSPVKKGMHFENHEEHEYNDADKKHLMRYYEEDKLVMRHECIKNDAGIVVSEVRVWIKADQREETQYSPDGLLSSHTLWRKGKMKNSISLEYTFNEQGDWIQCIHYDHKNKPKFLTERAITYYPDQDL